MSRMRALLLGVALFGWVRPANGHEVRPGYLDMRQTGAETYQVIWKVPMRGDLRLGLYLVLPDSCETTGPKTRYHAGGASIERQTVTCSGDLTGSTIRVDGLSGTMTDVIVRLERLDGTTQIARLSPSAPTFIVEAVPDRMQVAGTYLRLGIEHILLGIDHLLFVACLLLVAGSGRRLLVTITGFTLAHSVTLALSALELVRLPVPPVEAAIALSIVFLAVEIARGRKASLTFRYPIAVSSSFGLLHGFGFAAVLRGIGLPQNEIPTALLCFNIGVELGQVAFVGVLLLLLFAIRAVLMKNVNRPIHALAPWMRMPVAYVIGSVASYWLITRVGAFVGP